MSNARNHGATEGSADWLAFCDDGQSREPDKLARQLAAAAATGAELGLRRRRPYRFEPQHHERRPTAAAQSGRGTSATMEPHAWWFIERDCAQGPVLGRRRLGSLLINLADWDLWARLVRRGPPACVAAPLVGYRIHGGNASANTRLILREARLLDGRYGARIDYGELHHYLAWVCLRSGRRWTSLGHFAQAAARGQARKVAGSLAALSRGRLPTRQTTRTGFSDGPAVWIADAETWIAPIRDAAFNSP